MKISKHIQIGGLATTAAIGTFHAAAQIGKLALYLTIGYNPFGTEMIHFEDTRAVVLETGFFEKTILKDENINGLPDKKYVLSTWRPFMEDWDVQRDSLTHKDTLLYRMPNEYKMLHFEVEK